MRLSPEYLFYAIIYERWDSWVDIDAFVVV